MEIKRLILFAMLVIGLPVKVMAQGAPTAEDINNANNPLTPALGVNLQDQYALSYYGVEDSDSNALLLRGTLPHKLLSSSISSPTTTPTWGCGRPGSARGATCSPGRAGSR